MIPQHCNDNLKYATFLCWYILDTFVTPPTWWQYRLVRALYLFIWCQFERIKACSRNTLQYSKDYKNEKGSLSCKSITNCSLQPLENQSRRWIFFLKKVKDTLREKCPHSEFFWSLYSRIRTTYREMRSISPFQSEYGKIGSRKTPNTDITQWYSQGKSTLKWNSSLHKNYEYGGLSSWYIK